MWRLIRRVKSPLNVETLFGEQAVARGELCYNLNLSPCTSTVMVCVGSLWLLLVWPLCAPGWLAHKCVVYDDASDWPSDTNCPGVRHAASCSGVTDLRRDLRGLPGELRTLCVDVDRAKRVHSPLPVASFSALRRLRHLHVAGCFSRVLNGSFRGLAELRTLTLRHLYVPLDCCESAVVPAALLDLPRLRALHLHGYSLRKLPPHVFAARLPRLRGLFVNATCDDDLAEVICRVTPLLTSLTELTLAAPLVQELTRHNCSWNGASERRDFTTSANQRGDFPTSANQREDFTTSANQRGGFTTSANHPAVRLTVGMVTTVEHGALSCFPELTYLSLKMNEQLQEQLNKTAIRKIDLLDYGQPDLSMQEICAVVSAFSIKRVDLHYNNIDFSEFDPDQS
ncbi:uncharacterized protein LOC134079065 [Sardina pilchardus]|uniref:uncharacterized protein LOC134079065 n=1 Tax=Sardina pilchardus TaxID=27697 RepID=UPI002E13BE65